QIDPPAEPPPGPPREALVETPHSAPALAAATRARTPAKRRTLHLEGAPATAAGEGVGGGQLPDQGVPLDPRERGPPEDPGAPRPEPLRLYRAAYGKLMAGRAAEAEADFRDFVRRWPRHDYADNAQYWLGESFYARRDYTQAAPEFQQVVARWP